MKKFILIFLLLIATFSLTSCKEEPQENNAPELSGVVATAEIELGESFDALDGVTANDTEDGDVTTSVELTSTPELTFVSGVATPTEAGDYTITYSITDSNEATVTESLVLIVIETSVEVNPLTDYYYEYTIVYDGSEIVNFINFYENGVFYFSKYGGSQYQAGYYEIETDGSWDFETQGPNNSETDLYTETCTSRFVFYDVDGVTELGTAGWDEENLAVVGLELYGTRDFVANPESDLTPNDETGVVFGQFFIEGDEYSELLFNHNGTYTDAIDSVVYGTWTFASNFYTLTPDEGGDAYTFTLNEDGLTGTYVNGSFTTTLVAPVEAEPVHVLTDTHIDETYGDFVGTLTLYDDDTATLILDYYGAVTHEYSGTWAEDTSGDLTVTIDGIEYTATLSGTDTFNLEYTDENDIVLSLTNESGPTVLFSWTGTDSMLLDFYDDGTYVFEYASYSIVEEGTWTWENFEMTLTQSDDTVITATMDGTTYELSLDYVAVASDQLKQTFTVDSATWGAALGSSGSYTPEEYLPDLLFSWIGSDAMFLDFYDDGTYVFEYTSYGVVEEGTWTWENYTMTLTQSNDNVLTASLDGTTYELSIDYIAVASAQLTYTFTVDSATWSGALGGSGTYTPQ
ncbi:MAG: hypothetical protein ACVCEJ_04220 [Candidatus Izemoplasmataceae bacterium]